MKIRMSYFRIDWTIVCTNVYAIVCAVAITVFMSGPAAIAADQPGRIFDTEIENTIRLYATPVLTAAGLDPESVAIHIVNTPALNAFVSRGQNLFVTTGLLMATRHAGQLIGVMAHETGHIAGGHLARLDTLLRDSSGPALLSNVVGIAVAVLSGQPAAVGAISGGAQQALRRNVLSFARSHERSADRAALAYLDSTHQSVRGLLEFLEILDSEQSLIISRSRQQELSYDVTHPLTRDRIDFIRAHVAKSPYSDRKYPPSITRAHQRMVAKLKGYLYPLGRTLQDYPPSDTSVPARYARAVAYYRHGDITTSLPMINELIAQAPGDPYFRELKGEILFKNGRIAEALPPMELAVKALPKTPLLRISLAHAQIELNRAELLKPAIRNLEMALRVKRTMPIAWRLAATAYGRQNRLGRSALASAEYNLLIGRRKDAKRMAGRAQGILKRGSPGWLRAGDVINAVDRRKH
ncbi:MAG: M48 family metalloprotease [Rhodospirillales bacterium]|nr:M48 family metalloprotease [Rhodospirillales bacterium]